MGEEVSRDGVFMQQTDENILRQSELLAMRSISDALGIVNVSLREMNVRLNVVHDDMQLLKGQDLKSEHEKLKNDVEAYKSSNDKLVTDMRLNLAQYKGVFIPLSIVGSAMLAGLGTFVLERIIHG